MPTDTTDFDSLGVYPLTTIQERIRRLCNALQVTIDNTTGEEIAPIVVADQNISNTDILEQVNSSLMSAYMALIQDTPQIFARVVYITVVAGLATYKLPSGTMQLVSLKMLPPGTAVNASGQINPVPPGGVPVSLQPWQWIPIYEYDEDNLWKTQPSGNGWPTYRRDDDTIILSIIPATNIPNGLQLRTIVLPPPLEDPDDKIRTSLARIIQEYVIYDSAYVLYDTRKKAVPESVAQGRQEWQERLIRAAENMDHPRFTQFRSNRLVKWSYSGR